MTIQVGICCNNDLGRTDVLTAIHITDADGEEVLDLRADMGTSETISISGLAPEIELGVGDSVYWVESHSCWVGNIHWDAVEMPLAEATRLLNALLALKNWHVFGAEYDLSKAIEAERYITQQQLKVALR